MAVFEQFPYTNFHDLNLDYILKQVKEMQEKIDEFTELLATGPVVDVKTNINGTSTSIKNGSGIATLPAASDTTAGVINLDLISDDVVRISGAETVEVPVLTGGKIDESQLPPTVEPATASISGTVTLEESTDGIKIKGAGSTLEAAKLSSVPVLDANGDIDAAVIPATGVTAGSYGTDPNTYDAASHYVIFGAVVDAAGRITNIQQNPIPIIRTDIGTIPAGSYSQSIYFDVNNANYPWYNNACFANVGVYQQMTDSKGTTYLQALVHGTDYNYTIYAGYLTVILTAAKTSPVYIFVNGSYGRRGH